MFRLAYRKKEVWRIVSIAVFAIIVSLTGLGLWADIPGPKADHDVRVESFSPWGLTNQSVNITIKFSNSIVPVDSLNRPTTIIPVRISPEIDGVARWTATDVITIYPGQPLLPATEYRATVSPGGGFVNGNAIAKGQEFSFHTPALSVKLIRYQAQRSRKQNRQARLVFDLDFNYPVSRERLANSLRIEGRRDATKPSLAVIWPDTASDGTRLPTATDQFRLATELFDLQKVEQQYQLIIDRDILCVNCGNGLASDYSFTMAVVRNPKLNLIVEQVRADQVGKQGSIFLQFSSQVPIDEVRGHVKIDPPVPFSVSGRWRGVWLRGHFAPRTSYTVSVSAGILSANGELMERDFSGRVVMGDLKPTVRFTSPGLYMPREGNNLLEVSSVNLDALTIEVSQVFSNNLVTYMATGSDRSRGRGRGNDAYGRVTFTRDFPLESKKNEELISTIDLGAIIGDTLQGVFLVSARSRSSRWVADSRHVMMTDIGVMARMSDRYLLVWANSLSDADPIKDATVKLISRNNQLLVEGRTNEKGVVEFPDVMDQTEGYKPFVITVEKDGDLSYLRLDNSRLSTSDFDVAGRPYLTDGYEAFVYFDRGVFRPGETAHLVSMVRGDNGSLPEAFPYHIKIVNPRGRVFREYRLNADRSMASVDIELPKDIPTGKYKVTALLADNYILGQSSFLVEDFVPDRIKVMVHTDRSEYLTGDALKISVDGQMLYGAPAAGLKVKSEIVFSPVDFKPTGYSAYSFKVPRKDASIKRVSLGDTLLSDSGLATLEHVIDLGHRPPGRLSAQVWATVSETGGRGVSSFAEVKVFPYVRFVGIKTDLDGYGRTGEPVTVSVVVVKPDGSATVADSIQVTFNRIVYNSMLKKQSDGSYRFVSERSEEAVDSLWVAVGPEASQATFTPLDYGRYRIAAYDAASGHKAAVEFYAAGWGRVPWSLEEPDHLQLDLDKTEYSEGDIARLQVRAPFGGRLLLTVENQTVREYMILDLPENTGEIELPIKEDYAPNVYISATVIRPASEVSKGTPARAYGLIPVKVSAEARRVNLSISCPEEIRPNTKLLLDINTTAPAGAQLTVAAIDAGVLQLTAFKTPDPFQYFYGKRRPALSGFDLYSLIYPETDQATSHLSPPGGLSELSRSKQHLNPFQARRINVVSLWSGVVDVNESGAVQVTLDVPQFNGQLIIMAVVADADKFGSGSAEVLVREPIILQESFPRFIAPNDEVSGLVTVFNGLDSAATIKVEAEIDGQSRLISSEPRYIRLESGQQGAVEFPFKGLPAPGQIKVNLRASAGAEKTHSQFELSNRPARPLTTRFGSGTVTGDSTIVFTIPDDWVEGTAEYILRTSSISGLQMTRNIEYLLRYPYGCVEQTTSALFPLLYFDDIAKIVRPELFGGHGHEYFIDEGIDKLFRFQRDNGSFTYWPGADRIHNWSAIYASHFLIEARLAGYEIDNRGYKRTIRFLTDMARDRNYKDVKVEHRIYACLVLAKAGQLDKKLFNYLSGINAAELPGYSAYQLASALALAGDLDRAREIVPFDVQPNLTPPESGGNFASGARDDAILLDLLLSVDPQNPSAAVLARSLLERARLNRWYNTQATAYSLMALGKYFRSVEPSTFTGEIVVEGGASYKIDNADFKATDNDLGGKQISITIDGRGPCFYFWQASGVPLRTDSLEFDRGITVRREYLDASGSPADLSSVALGSQLVGHITISGARQTIENVVIADLLPAGFEIENKRLANSPLMPWIPRRVDQAQYQDIRDDRILLFVNLRGGSKNILHFYYGLRAIASGDFVVPPVAAECMYNPLVAGAGSSGRVIITGAGK